MSESLVSRGMRDGVEVHKAALQAGFNSRLLPRQVLQISRERSTTSFTHGIPQGSTLSGVTFTQDLRMRRGLLGKAGIPQPKGATFSIGKGRRPIRKYARKIGYPVVVKPALGDSTIDVERGVRGTKSLDRALNKLLVPPDQRPYSTRAAYGITELRAPGKYKGRLTVPPGYRVLVEEEVAGDYIRLLLLKGEFISAVRFNGDPWGEGLQVLSSSELSEPVRALALKTARALPGLELLSIDLVVRSESNSQSSVRSRDSHHGQDQEAKADVVLENDEPGDEDSQNDYENQLRDEAEVLIVDVSERPWLEVQHKINPSLSNRLAQKIVHSAFETPAASTPRLGAMSVDLDFEGVVSPGEFIDAVKSYASNRKVDISLDIRNRALGYVGGRVVGTADEIVALAEIILDDGIDGQSAMKAEITQ